MEISLVKRHDKTLLIRRQGEHGWGAQGTSSVRKICKSANEWIDSHPTVRISRLFVDFSEVHCELGDGPAQLGIETYKRGIHEMGPPRRPPDLNALSRAPRLRA